MPEMLAPIQPFRRLKAAFLLICLLSAVISGCGSGKLRRARNAFYDGQLDQASTILSDKDKVSSRDRLLYYMEKGTILHYMGDFQGSADILLKASDLMRQQDVISVSRQTASLVTTEWLTDYKGEYAERLLVHTYLMMNFLMLGDHESALVEAKQALEVYDAFPEACNGDFFTRALIAHCFEALGEINGAYIEYKKLAELMPDPSPVARKLCDLGRQLGFDDEVEHFSALLPEKERNQRKRETGELLIFVSQGKSPVKIPQDIVIPPSIRFSFSTYEDRSGNLPLPSVGPLAGPVPPDMITTNVGAVLKTSLKERLTAILAKETARVAAKEAIAHNIHDDNIEALMRIAFFLTEVPDTRCWQTLPAYMTLVCVPRYADDPPVNLYDMGQPVRLPESALSAGNRSFYQYYAVRNISGPSLFGASVLSGE